MSRLASMDENMFEALTGVTKASFRSFFGGTRDRFDTSKVSLLHRLLLFFVKMKMGLDFSTLANLITKGYRWYKSEYLVYCYVYTFARENKFPLTTFDLKSFSYWRMF